MPNSCSGPSIAVMSILHNNSDKETPAEKVTRITQEEIAGVPCNFNWPEMFRCEREHLRTCLPSGIGKRIEHFGSTAVPGLIGKPIIDILVEATSLGETKVKNDVL
jgi:GrpB-like predicted nucleotidyltransferase (UPF0157 family)